MFLHMKYTPFLLLLFLAGVCLPLAAQVDEFEEFRNMGQPGQRKPTSTNHSHAPEPPAGPAITVKKVHVGMPKDLFSQPLLFPMYEYIDESQFSNPTQLKQIESMNSRMTSENKALRGYYTNYKGPYEVILFEDYEKYYQKGHKYVLDFVWMPKQMEEYEEKAMEPFFTRAGNLNEALVENRPQFWTYFYIRDLQTDEAYILRDEVKGYKPFEFYKGIEEFLKKVSQEVEKQN